MIVLLVFFTFRCILCVIIINDDSEWHIMQQTMLWRHWLDHWMVTLVCSYYWTLIGNITYSIVWPLTWDMSLHFWCPCLLPCCLLSVLTVDKKCGHWVRPKQYAPAGPWWHRYSIGPRRLRLITWPCDLDLWTCRSWALWLMRVVVVLRTPSLKFVGLAIQKTWRTMCVSINGPGDLDLWPWNWFASRINGGEPSY